MMLEEKIMEDYKQAMKDKDSLKVSVISFLRAQIKYAVIEKKVDKLPDADIIAVIKKQVKQRQDSISQFEQGGRADLAEKEKSELTILKGYLPVEMSAEDVKKIVLETIKETNASGIKDMGKVMKAVLTRVAGKADSRLVSDLVRESLA